MVIKYEKEIDTEINNIVNTITNDEYMLNSNMLADTFFINKLEQTGMYSIINCFAKIFCKGIIFWIVFMIFALFTNGGFIVDIILIVLITLSFCFSLANTNATYFQMAYYNAFGNKDGFSNTMKEARWLIKELKECEKEKDTQKKKRLYQKLVDMMNKKYGKYHHALVAPLSEGEKERKSYLLALYRNIVYNINNYEKNWMPYCVALYSPNGINRTDFKLSFNELSNTLIDMMGRKVFPFLSTTFTKDIYCYIDENILGFFCAKVKDEKQIGLLTLLEMRQIKSGMYELFDVDPFNYYSDNNITCLEGKLIYEYLMEINKEYPIKDVLFKELNETKYHNLCKAVERYKYTKQDLIIEIKKVNSVYSKVFNYSWRLK